MHAIVPCGGEVIKICSAEYYRQDFGQTALVPR